MNKIKLITILMASVLAVYSCNQTDQDGFDETNGLMVDGSDAKTALDWSGTYSGVLPCADCEGIQTELTLKEDGNYILTSEYLTGAKNGFVETKKGAFSWEGNL